MIEGKTPKYEWNKNKKPNMTILKKIPKFKGKK